MDEEEIQKRTKRVISRTYQLCDKEKLAFLEVLDDKTDNLFVKNMNGEGRAKLFIWDKRGLFGTQLDVITDSDPLFCQKDDFRPLSPVST